MVAVWLGFCELRVVRIEGVGWCGGGGGWDCGVHVGVVAVLLVFLWVGGGGKRCGGVVVLVWRCC